MRLAARRCRPRLSLLRRHVGPPRTTLQTTASTFNPHRPERSPRPVSAPSAETATGRPPPVARTMWRYWSNRCLVTTIHSDPDRVSSDVKLFKAIDTGRRGHPGSATDVSAGSCVNFKGPPRRARSNRRRITARTVTYDPAITALSRRLPLLRQRSPGLGDIIAFNGLGPSFPSATTNVT